MTSRLTLPCILGCHISRISSMQENQPPLQVCVTVREPNRNESSLGYRRRGYFSPQTRGIVHLLYCIFEVVETFKADSQPASQISKRSAKAAKQMIRKPHLVVIDRHKRTILPSRSPSVHHNLFLKQASGTLVLQKLLSVPFAKFYKMCEFCTSANRGVELS